MLGVRCELKLGIEQFVVVRIEEKIMFQLYCHFITFTTECTRLNNDSRLYSVEFH